MLFSVGSLPNGPRLETRKALLVMDLQNDFVREDGKLFVKNTKEFLHKLPSLVAKFREKGEVFWAHTEFHETRPTISSDLGSAVIVLKEFLDTRKRDDAGVSHVAEQLEQSSEQTMEYPENDDPEAFLAQRNRAKWPRCCLPNTPGCDTAEVVASMINHTRDSRLMKTDYSAFQTKSLLLPLRFAVQHLHLRNRSRCGNTWAGGNSTRGLRGLPRRQVP